MQPLEFQGALLFVDDQFIYLISFIHWFVEGGGVNMVFSEIWRLALLREADCKTFKILNVKTEDFKIA